MAAGDGWRIGMLGNTGTGKTYVARQLVAHTPGKQLTLIHDDSKTLPEYPGVPYVHQAAAWRAVPAGAQVIGFRGDAYAGLTVEVDEVAALAMQLARARVPIRLVVDELNRAVSEASGKALESDQLRAAITVGRTMKLCVLWGTQTPQRVPGMVLDNTSAVLIFALGAHALNYLDDRLFFDPAMLAVVGTFKAHPDPAAGEFVIHRPGHPWDRTIYRFGPVRL